LVHGHDGLDEISVCAPTRVSELKDGRIATYDLSPETFFGGLADPKDMEGGDPAANAAITKNILAGERGARRNVILINSAAALVTAGKASDIRDGIKMAEAAIDSGAAAEKLSALAEFTHENG